MNRIIKLNREKKLGLRIIPTIRLRVRKGKSPSLIMTKLKPKAWINLDAKQRAVFSADAERQISILKENGYECDRDGFFAIVSANKSCVAVIGDFGSIKRTRKP